MTPVVCVCIINILPFIWRRMNEYIDCCSIPILNEFALSYIENVNVRHSYPFFVLLIFVYIESSLFPLLLFFRFVFGLIVKQFLLIRIHHRLFLLLHSVPKSRFSMCHTIILAKNRNGGNVYCSTHSYFMVSYKISPNCCTYH